MAVPPAAGLLPARAAVEELFSGPRHMRTSWQPLGLVASNTFALLAAQ
jgi:hypothetical protein